MQVGEAEAMVSGGIQDVFISNEVVAPSKITRMVALAAQGRHWFEVHFGTALFTGGGTC